MANMEEIIQSIEKLTVLELAELVKALEQKFGVSAAPVAVAAGPAAGAGDAGKAAEQTSFTVMLANAGGQKIQVIKVVREVTGLGLAEAKALVDSAPKAVKDGVTKEEADAMKAKFEGTGATIEIK
jgi:large subunit ribosomal protein L7/L12